MKVNFSSIQRWAKIWVVLALAAFNLLLFGANAFAHHALGGKLPANAFEGFISGLAHPIIGFDHFAFVVSIGLLAGTKRQGISIAIAFVLTAMLGTGFHLIQLNLPAVELFVSGSVLFFGILLAMKDSPNYIAIASFAALAGLFHGYAYGEAIFGAEMTPLISYLAGFTAIQLIIATSAFLVGKAVLKQTESEQSPLKLRFAGFVICGAGAAFLSSQIVSAIFPALT